jgi:hypothetical protein
MNFLNNFLKNIQVLIFKHPYIGAELFHSGERTDGYTNKTNSIVVYRKFAKAPKVN